MDENQTDGNELPPDRDTMLLGFIRDRMLDAAKRFMKWDEFPETTQVSVNVTFEQIARDSIREITRTAAARQFPFAEVSVSGLHQKDKEVLEAKLFANDTDENATFLLRAGRCLLVKADPEKFMGAKPAPVMKDQPDLIDDVQADGTIVDKETGEIIASPKEAGKPRGRPRKPREPSAEAAE